MPTYQYVCTACAERLEAVQAFADDAITECPACGGRLRKVFSPVGVVFKGSGFYKTDSRAAAKKAKAAAEPAAGGDGAGSKDTAKPSGEKSTDATTDAKPAAAAASSGKSADSPASSTATPATAKSA